jgi:hypothetical protein
MTTVTTPATSPAPGRIPPHSAAESGATTRSTTPVTASVATIPAPTAHTARRGHSCTPGTGDRSRFRRDARPTPAFSPRTGDRMT